MLLDDKQKGDKVDPGYMHTFISGYVSPNLFILIGYDNIEYWLSKIEECLGIFHLMIWNLVKCLAM